MNIEKFCSLCLTIVILAILGSCTASGFDRREKWAQAVKNGADPIAVTCALGGAQNSADDLICYAVANKR